MSSYTFRPLLFAFPRPSHFLFLFELPEDKLPENDDDDDEEEEEEEEEAVIAELLLLVNFLASAWPGFKDRMERKCCSAMSI